MELSVAIDAFRLATAPRTSHSIYITEMVKSLSQLEEICRLVLLVPRHPEVNPGYSSLLEDKKVEILWPSAPSHPDLSFRAELYWTQRVIPALLRKLPAACNTYIAPYHHPPFLLPRSTRVVTVIHDVCGLKTSAGYVKTKKAYYQHLLMFCFAAIRSDVIVPISKFTKREFTKAFPFLRERVSDVVYNSIKCETQNDRTADQILRKYDVSRGTYFLAFGLPGVRKGFDLVSASYVAYKNGGGKRSLFLIVPKEYHEFVTRKLLSEKIYDARIVCDIDFEDRDALYNGATALLFPSRCEGFGYPIVEAMRQGCPPVACWNSPAAEIVDAHVPLLHSLSVEAIVESMVRYEGMDCDARRELRQELIARSLAFENNQFGRWLVGISKGWR